MMMTTSYASYNPLPKVPTLQSNHHLDVKESHLTPQSGLSIEHGNDLPFRGHDHGLTAFNHPVYTPGGRSGFVNSPNPFFDSRLQLMPQAEHSFLKDDSDNFKDDAMKSDHGYDLDALNLYREFFRCQGFKKYRDGRQKSKEQGVWPDVMEWAFFRGDYMMTESSGI